MRIGLLSAAVVVVIGGLGASTSFAQSSRPASTTKWTTTTSSAAPAPADVRAWAAKLGHESYKVREEAQQKLIEMGDAVEPAMRELAATTKDPEVQTRAEVILSRLQAAREAAARAKAMGGEGASLVTLHFKNAPAKQVYRSLFEQAHATLTTLPRNLWEAGNGGPIGSVTIDLDQVPFWMAMQELEAQTGLGVTSTGQGIVLASARFRGNFAGGAGKSVTIRGPYMLVANDPPPNAGNGMARMLQVFVEPKLNVVATGRTPDVDEAADAAGNPINLGAAPGVPGGRLMGGSAYGEGNVFTVHLIDPRLRNAAYVRGSVTATVATASQRAEFDNAAALSNVERNVQGVRLLADCMKISDDEYALMVVGVNTKPPAAGLRQLRMRMLDAAGGELDQSSGGSSTSDQRVMFNSFYRRRAGIGAPSKLIVEFPTETREVKIPFEFGQPPAGHAGGGAGGGAAGESKPATRPATGKSD